MFDGFQDQSVQEFHDLSFGVLSKQVYPLKNKKQMFSAIEAVRYTLKEMLQTHGEDAVLRIIRYGTAIPKTNNIVPENNPLLDRDTLNGLYDQESPEEG